MDHFMSMVRPLAAVFIAPVPVKCSESLRSIVTSPLDFMSLFSWLQSTCNSTLEAEALTSFGAHVLVLVLLALAIACSIPSLVTQLFTVVVRGLPDMLFIAASMRARCSGDIWSRFGM